MHQSDARLPFQSHPNPRCSVPPAPFLTQNISLSAKNRGEPSHPGPARPRSLLRITMSPSTVSFQKSTNNLLPKSSFCGPSFAPLGGKLLDIPPLSLKTFARETRTCVFHCCRRVVCLGGGRKP